MERHILKYQGFSLVELSIVMGVIAVLATAILPIAVRSIEMKAGEKTVTEVVLIQDAARKFYSQQKAWPSDLAQLQAMGYLSTRWSLLNPWGNPYQISSTPKIFSVSTVVPQNLVSMLAFRLPQSSVDQGIVSSAIGIGTVTGVVPAGVITVWSGTIADIPEGWALCDGTSGTPDLRDKFIVGAKQDDDGAAKSSIMGSLLQTGGSINHDHGGSTGAHVLTIAEMPAHSHSILVNDRTTSGPANSPYPEVADVHSVRPDQSSVAGGNQAHTHSITSDFNVPPFYALAFIMKLP